MKASPKSPMAIWELGLVFSVTVLPFEPVQTLALGPLSLSLFELALAFTALAFAATELRKGRGVPLRPTEALAAIWLGSALLSGVEAGVLQGFALKTALRWIGVATLFVLVRVSPHRRRLVEVLVGTGCLVAILGIVEMSPWGGYVEGFLTTFRPQTSSTQGILRLTATFSHANQAAGFLAMSLPVAVGYAIRGRWWTPAYPALLTFALWMTLSRAGIVAGLLGALLTLAFQLRSQGWKPHLLGIGAPLLLTPLLLVGSETVNHRFFRPSDPSLRVEVEAPTRVRACSGSTREVRVRVTNTGTVSWSPRAPHPVQLAYTSSPDNEGKWFEGAEREIVPRRVPPGERLDLTISVRAPRRPGTHVLQWDMVREGVAWFGDLLPKGSPSRPARTELLVEHEGCPVLPAGPRPRRQIVKEPPFVQQLYSPRRAELWQAAWQVWRKYPVLGAGPDTFRQIYPPFLPMEAQRAVAQTSNQADWDYRVHANSLYLELLADTGLLGFVLWLILYGRLLWEGHRRLGKHRYGCFAAIVTWGVHGILDSFLSFYGVAGVMWVCAGLATADRRQEEE